MFDKYDEARLKYANEIESKPAEASIESHMIYELKAKREYLLRKLVAIQNAIDAVSKI